MKADVLAQERWGREAYDAIPKSVFAMAAWHLANAASDTCDDDGAAERRFIEEIEALRGNELITDNQAKTALRVLKGYAR